MKVIDIPLVQIGVTDWNPNQMDDAMGARLRRSIERFGLVAPLVVRKTGEASYETVGGAQRLWVLQKLGFTHVPSVVVGVDDNQARLLSQALNRIQGEDDLGLKPELLREVLEQVPQEQVLVLLPETTHSLQAFVNLGQIDIAQYLRNWERTQAARLHHFQFQLTTSQLEVVQEALALAKLKVDAAQTDSPNVRGTALFLLCEAYLTEHKEL